MDYKMVQMLCLNYVKIHIKQHPKTKTALIRVAGLQATLTLNVATTAARDAGEELNTHNS